MKVIGNHIAANPVPHSTMTESGLFLAPSEFMEGSEAIVRAIGTGIKESREYTKGSKVYVEMYKAQKHEATINGEKFVFLSPNDIAGVDANGRYHPIGDRILLRPLPLPQSTIIAPDIYDAEEGTVTWHEVYLCGTGTKTKKGVLCDFDIKIGDKICTIANIGRDVMAGSEVFKLVLYKDIMGKMENES